MIKQLYFILTITLVSKTGDCLIKCPLVWEPSSFGEILPEASLPTASYGEVHHIARVFYDGRYIGGRAFNGTGYFAYNSQTGPKTVIETTFEVLTNPHKCVINWMRGAANDEFIIPIFPNANYHVGRSLFSTELLSGEISAGIIYISNNGAQSPTIFEYLRSYSKGLIVTLDNFIFKDAAPAGVDFLGMDEIDNRSGMKLSHTVLFKKRVTQITSFKNTKSSSFTANVDISIEPEIELVAGTNATIKGPKLDLGYEYKEDEERSKEIITEVETTVEVIREVQINGHMSIQICSTIAMLDDFSLSYVAEGKYRAPGLNADEVAQILLKDNIRGVAFEDSILTEESGILAGKMAMSTTLIVVTSEAPEGCSELSTKIADYKFAKKSGKYVNQELNNKAEEIYEMINRMRGSN